jgi:hypothetical protein
MVQCSAAADSGDDRHEDDGDRGFFSSSLAGSLPTDPARVWSAPA